MSLITCSVLIALYVYWDNRTFTLAPAEVDKTVHVVSKN